jgi:hypothetical protein
MKTIVLIFISLFSFYSLADDFFPVTSIIFEIATPHPLEKLEMTLKYPEGLLQKFKPEGAKVTKKNVSINNVSFNATKSYLLVSQTIFVTGAFDSNESSAGCLKSEKGFDINFTFEGSDSLVENNIDRIEVKLCVKEINQNLISGSVKGKIVKGKNYSSIIGPFVKGIIEAQINPLLKALHDDVLSQKY